tara:strand:+ start:1184 stop:1810 length:627 start_codon:yes stop_codon:yes gene_type:complete
MLEKKLSYWYKALNDLKRKDKILAKIIINNQKEQLTIRDRYFISLIRAIIGQQISVKAAQSIWVKFKKKYKTISPKKLSKENIRNLRKLGLSKQKASYVKNISNFFLLNKVKIKNWKNLPDDKIINELTSIKGIGTWTAEMFLIFSLGRPNVFPIKDLGLLKAISINYKKKLPLQQSFLIKLKKKWHPWCSVATWFLWRSIDPIPVSY